MHDPKTVAFEIKRPWPTKRSPHLGGFRHWPALVTIWHVDPERRGDENSCGWFMRARHGDPAVLEKIRHAFEFEWDADHGGWFYEDGRPRLSVVAITLNMFWFAAWEFFGHSPRRADAFMRRHLYDLLFFAENNTDSLHNGITLRYGLEKREDRIASFSSTVYGWILRAERPWYRHPRWHFWHWEIQVRVVQSFKRWAWSRCERCGGRFRFGEAPVSSQWHSDGPRWFRGERHLSHSRCAHSQPQSAA